MKHDVANEVIRETYRKKSLLTAMCGRSPESIRSAFVHAKRFVLDAEFSEFLGHLAAVPFRVAIERRPDVLDSLRHSAVPPFNKMWLQIDGRAFRKGLVDAAESKTDVYGTPLVTHDSDEVPEHYGWLIERDDKNPDIVYISEYMGKGEYHGEDQPVMSFPFQWAYSLSDQPLPNSCDIMAGMFAHGLTGLLTRQIGVRYSKPLSEFPNRDLVDVVRDDNKTVFDESVPPKWTVHNLVPETGGVVRYILVFLATLNDTPKIQVDTRVQKSYMGGGQIRKYLEHTVLKLSLPAKQSKIVAAKRLIALARRGWHEVRPHWRITHQLLGGRYCSSREAHIWGSLDVTGHAYCKHCDAKRVWIVLPHGRGDPLISVRTHKYHVTHQE